MTRRTHRTKRNTTLRTYPIYTIAASDLSNHENIIKMKPDKRNRYHQEKKLELHAQNSILIPVATGHQERRSTKFLSSRKQKSATIQTDEIIPTNLSRTEKNQESSKKKSTICNRQCLRIFAVILASFILLISLLLLAFSLNLLLNPNMTKIRSVAIVYAQALPSSGFTGKGPTDTLVVTAIMGIVYSCVTMIISIVIIICLICIKFRYYASLFYSGLVLLLILFFMLVGLGIFIAIIGDTELQRLASSTQTTVYAYYNSTSTSLVRDGWDFVQYYFSCCGVKDNNTDWYPTPSAGWKYNSQLPRSCCGHDSNEIGHAGRIFVGSDVPPLIGICYYGDIGQPTCYNSIRTNLFITALAFIYGLAFLILILAISFLILMRMHRKLNHRAENPIAK